MLWINSDMFMCQLDKGSSALEHLFLCKALREIPEDLRPRPLLGTKQWEDKRWSQRTQLPEENCLATSKLAVLFNSPECEGKKSNLIPF